MPTLTEILDDRKNFPDDRKITLADGVETTLGELRGGYMKDADYRQKTTKLAREREEFMTERQRFEQDRKEAEEQLAAMVEKAITQGAPRSQQIDEWQAYLDQNPAARRLQNELTETKKQLEEFSKKFEDQDRRHVELQQSMLADQHRRALAALKSHDPELNETELVQFARDNAIPRLDLAYRLFTEDKRWKREVDKVKETTHKEAYEKAKRDLAQPMLPNRRVAPTVPEDAPKSFDEAADRAARDPEILATMEGWGG